MGGNFKNNLVSGVLKICIPTFGEPIEYRPAKGGSFKLKAVFDREFLAIDPNTEATVSSNNPAVGIRLADLPVVPKQGDKVKIENEIFKIEDSVEDGQGGATLTLIKV